MKIIKPSYEIIDQIDGQAILKKLELIGRVSHKSEGKITETSAAPFVKKLIQLGDESVLEHVSITVRFICDRGISHELVRHRLAAITQESTRCCNYSQGKFGDEITVIRPDFLKEGSFKYVIWRYACMYAEQAYFHLLENGATPEEARAVLPNSLKTEVIMTCNLREWRHILSLRTNKRAHPQMRELMIPLLHELQNRVPVVFDDIVERINHE
mgnify:CR=1 FL=1